MLIKYKSNYQNTSAGGAGIGGAIICFNPSSNYSDIGGGVIICFIPSSNCYGIGGAVKCFSSFGG